ncbi:MAG: Na/Pi symporter [bacterium]|jgi:sodium-dependent phosphate cotransporter|nr:Na/Pi symporter [bacterium]
MDQPKITFSDFLLEKNRKLFRISITLLRILALFFLVYLFLLSITLMGSAFKFFGQDFANRLIATTSNPLVGLVIGILSTSIVQSSSTTTSIVVGLVGAGALSIANAIPIIMGANVGTSVTNLLVSLGHISQKAEFRRAFGAAVVHDLFNLIAVLILFPIQCFTNLLGQFSQFFANAFQSIGGLHVISPIKIVTSPVIKIIEKLTGRSGIIELIISLVLLFIALRYLVKVLKLLFIGKMEVFFDKVIFKNALTSLLFGLILTALIQSSSITTSFVVPLVGAGILTLEQIFPYTLGANIGTTVTAMLASLATGNISAITVAFAHFSFNIIGVALIFPVRFIPISLAKWMADLSIKSKIYPLIYIAGIFFIFPLLIIYFMR